jgi:hypothetical protein
VQLFLRQNFSQLWITLSSNETLGLLDSDYLQDYFGVDGQITLYNTNTGIRYPVLMNELTSDTPDIPHDVFSGVVELDDISNGLYRIEGRVKDIVDHYTVLSEVETPIGDENIIELEIQVNDTDVIIYFDSVITIKYGVNLVTQIIGNISADAVISSPVFEGNILQPSKTNMVTGVSFKVSMESING